MVRFPLGKFLEHQIHRVLKFLIVFPDLHGIDELDEGGKVLFLHRGFIVDIPDKGAVQKRFRLDPEIVPGLTLALGVGDQRCHQFQDVLFAVKIGKRIVVHGLLEVDGIKDLNAVWLIDHLAVFILHSLINRVSMLIFYRLMILAQPGAHFRRTALEHLAALHQNGPLGVRDHIGRVHLHQIRLQPKPSLTGTGTAHD